MNEVAAVEPQEGADASPAPEPAETVETEVEAAEQAEATESETESPPVVEENDEEKTDPFQERIDKLTRNWRETERALQQMETENRELRQRVSEIPEPQEPVKTLADFEYDEAKYQQYMFDRAEQSAERAAERVVRGFEGKQDAERRDTLFQSREREFATTVKDYHEVVYAEDLRITATMADELKASEIGPELGYYLGKNPDIAAEIAALDDRGAMRRMVRLEAELLGDKAKLKGKTVSEAPPPPSKVKATEPGVRVAADSEKSDKLSDAEWLKRRERDLAKRNS